MHGVGHAQPPVPYMFCLMPHALAPVCSLTQTPHAHAPLGAACTRRIGSSLPSPTRAPLAAACPLLPLPPTYTCAICCCMQSHEKGRPAAAHAAALISVDLFLSFPPHTRAPPAAACTHTSRWGQRRWGRKRSLALYGCGLHHKVRQWREAGSSPPRTGQPH